jgi:Terminase large subunit, endonuclease domain
VFAITTEGESSGREESILGQLVDENEAQGDVERLPGVTISRHHESRTLVFRFHAIDAKAADPRPLRLAHAELKRAPSPDLEAECERLETALLDSVMPANPASWITPEYILRQALSAKVMPSDFLQLHAGVAADSQERWIDRETWNALKSDAEPSGRIVVAVDAARSHDSTAVTWGCLLDDGRVVGRCHAWCARRGAAAHEFVPGGRIRNDSVKDFIRSLNERLPVEAVVYDERYFGDAATELSDEGFNMIELAQNSSDMRDAEQQFHDAVMEGLFTHDGDPVLTAHVAATVAEKRDAGPNGVWKIRKLENAQVIDGVVSMIMCHYHTRRLEGEVEVMIAFA